MTAGPGPLAAASWLRASMDGLNHVRLPGMGILGIFAGMGLFRIYPAWGLLEIYAALDMVC